MVSSRLIVRQKLSSSGVFGGKNSKDTESPVVSSAKAIMWRGP